MPEVARGGRFDRGEIGAIIIVVILVLVALVTYFLFANIGVAYGLGVASGLLSGVLVVFLVYWLTGPRLVFSITGDKYDGVSAGLWLHLTVENKSWNLLGTGTAYDCVSHVEFEGKGIQRTSWASRPNPRQKLAIQLQPGQVTTFELADPLLYEQKRTMTIRPEEKTDLDVAWRAVGETDGYVSIPEHFQGVTLARFPELKLEPKEHPFSVRLVYSGGRTRRHRFVLVNRGGNNLTSETFFIRG